MCGIFGIWNRNKQQVDRVALERAGSVLCHRGPDDEGYLLASSQARTFMSATGKDSQPGLDLPSVRQVDGDFDLAFGFRRLSILDLSLQGHQPMVSEDQRFVLVFNGEIYNYIELRTELASQGFTFHSTSDTEVLLAAYRAWGASALTRFTGMFSLAILDLERAVLFLARDFFGIKPLYYTLADGKFAFASEIPVLLNLSGVSRRANTERLFQYLRFGRTDDGGTTLFADIQQVPPAHYLELSLDHPGIVEPQKYWEPTPEEITDLSFDEAATTLREMFIESVGMHLRSDVPVGAALSGGIDSSAIVMAMRHLCGDALDLHTFSYVADDPVVSEEKWVDLIGERSHARVHKVRIQPTDLVDDINHLITVQGEPFGGTSIYAQYRVFRLAQQAGIKVMLDGQGADELLGGYGIAIAARFASMIQQGRLMQAGDFLRRAQSGAGRRPGDTQLWLRAGHFLIPEFIQGPLRRLAGEDIVPAWMNGQWFVDRGAIPHPAEHPRARHMLREELLTSLVRTSLPALLRYEDRNSMAHSIESRVPFLTPGLVNFILSMPEEYLVSPDGTTKAIFRKAMRGTVPDSILDRKDKIGFATPEKALLTTLKPWVEDALQTSRLAKIPALKPEVVQQRWQTALNAQGLFDTSVWRWVNLVKWTEEFDVDYAA
jgi:asparagine synthase (glutamine-hydrolysing)